MLNRYRAPQAAARNASASAVLKRTENGPFAMVFL
jgi:hypothetical protein